MNGGHSMPRTDIGTVARSQEQSDRPGMMMPVLCHHQTVAIHDRSNLPPKDQSNVPMASSSRFSLQHTVSGELTLGTQSHWASEPQSASPVRCWVSHEGRKVVLNDLQVATRPLAPT